METFWYRLTRVVLENAVKRCRRSNYLLKCRMTSSKTVNVTATE